MKKQIALLVALLTVALSTGILFAQTNARPYKCGFVSKNISELTKNYKSFSRHLGVQPGEVVASVGASSGYVEVQISSFVDSIRWTIQDIDTTCLNAIELNRVIEYHEKLINKRLNGAFDIVIGNTLKTNLPRLHYDRILLVNVFHELTEKKSIMLDISNSLKQQGVVVVMERMGTKAGQKHSDCGHMKLLEPEFISEMNRYGFKLVAKVKPNKKTSLTFYTFQNN